MTIDVGNLAARVVEVVALSILAAHVSGTRLLTAEQMDRARMVQELLPEVLSSRAKEALKDLQSKPESDDNRADLRKQLSKFFEEEPSIAEAVDNIIPESISPKRGDVIIQNVSSALGRAAQITGSFNKVRIE
jgi:hypothetical protein